MSDDNWKKRLGGEGILKDSDLADFTEAERRIAKLMDDGRWHPAQEIIAVARQREGLRRMRALRALPRIDIERRRVPEARDFEYRLVVSHTAPPPPPRQGDLFS